MSDIVTFRIEDGVGVITLNRPDQLNALSDDMHAALEEAVVAAQQSEEVRVIVLTGAGRAFSAGADMKRLDRLIEGRGANYDLPRPGIVPEGLKAIDAPPELLHAYTFPLALSKPVIAAINGPCVGAAFVIAACCDVRFISQNGFFNAAFAQRGLIAEAGLAWLLPRMVGHNFASDILLSGRRVGAEEALRIGLVSAVHAPEDLLPAVIEYARTMARTTAPRSMRLVKRQIQTSYDQTFGEAAREAHDLLLESLAHDDFIEGVRSFQEKRAPDFTGR